MDTSLHFTNATHVSKLKAAILLYVEQDKSHANMWQGREADYTAATIHPVVNNEIQSGRPLGKKELESTLHSLQARQNRERVVSHFIPEHVFALGEKLMAWWMPSRIDRIWFHPSDRHQEDVDALTKISGEKVYHPPLVFIARPGKTVDVYALAKSERPSMDTVLFKAPYWNISDRGGLCVGGAVMPRELGVSRTADYEKGFFASNFAHNNYHSKMTTHPGGHNGLWAEMLVESKAESRNSKAPSGVRPSTLDPRLIATRHARYLVPSSVKTVGHALKALQGDEAFDDGDDE